MSVADALELMLAFAVFVIALLTFILELMKFINKK